MSGELFKPLANQSKPAPSPQVIERYARIVLFQARRFEDRGDYHRALARTNSAAQLLSDRTGAEALSTILFLNDISMNLLPRCEEQTYHNLNRITLVYAFKRDWEFIDTCQKRTVLKFKLINMRQKEEKLAKELAGGKDRTDEKTEQRDSATPQPAATILQKMLDWIQQQW